MCSGDDDGEGGHLRIVAVPDIRGTWTASDTQFIATTLLY